MGGEESKPSNTMHTDSIIVQNKQTIKTRPVITKFSPQSYMGDWWEIARYDNLLYEKGCSKAYAHYQLNHDGTIDITNTCYKNNEAVNTDKGIGRIPNKCEPGKLLVSFSLDKYKDKFLSSSSSSNMKPNIKSNMKPNIKSNMEPNMESNMKPNMSTSEYNISNQGFSDKSSQDGLHNNTLASAEGQYWIHYTDYENYSIVGGPDDKFLWILCRRKTIRPEDFTFLLDLVAQIGYRIKPLIFDRSVIDDTASPPIHVPAEYPWKISYTC